ncbi:glycoside hydrolase family 5 protein [Mongoliimonas terrestris]|uniref:glycoside hydrolase family 5 protein n=1 Tax=Mongoliimonas terrestris TaxID=1709001 RepID=UPI0009FA46E4|nr:cellulase family glycosylhydrolase [Mongoliimonas terrestris]
MRRGLAAPLLAALMAAAHPIGAAAQPAGETAPATTPGAACAARFQVPADRLARLARGYNLTGWIDVRDEREPDAELLQALRRAGMTHVRLPVPAEDLMPAFATAERTAARLRAIAAVLDRMIALDTAVVLDLHPGGDLARLYAEAPDAALGEILAAWDRLIPLVAARPAGLVFPELLNEPPTTPERWDGDARRIAAHLRAALPDHTLVIGPAGPQRVEPLMGRPPVEDANTVQAIHFYDPMAFTHQGATWMGDDPHAALAEVPFPAAPGDPALRQALAGMRLIGRPDAADLLARSYEAPWDAARIAAVFRDVSVWSARTGLPVVVGEFGVLRFAAPPADRAAWIRAVREAAEAACIGWTHWEFRDGFGLVDPRTGAPEPAVMDALGMK